MGITKTLCQRLIFTKDIINFLQFSSEASWKYLKFNLSGRLVLMRLGADSKGLIIVENADPPNGVFPGNMR